LAWQTPRHAAQKVRNEGAERVGFRLNHPICPHRRRIT
jgi:RES domain-containing protein